MGEADSSEAEARQKRLQALRNDEQPIEPESGESAPAATKDERKREFIKKLMKKRQQEGKAGGAGVFGEGGNRKREFIKKLMEKKRQEQGGGSTVSELEARTARLEDELKRTQEELEQARQQLEAASAENNNEN